MSCSCRHSGSAQGGGHTPSAGPITGTPRLETVHKMGGTGQLSPQMAADFPVVVGSEGSMVVQYNAPRPSIPPGGSHCSDVRVRFLLDGREIHTTTWLGYEGRTPALPLHSDLLALSGLASGPHTITVQPEGREGGCNTGRLYAWDGTLLIFA